MTPVRAEKIRAAWARVRRNTITSLLQGYDGRQVRVELREATRIEVVPDTPESPPCSVAIDTVTFSLEWGDLPAAGGRRPWRIVGDGVEVEVGLL